MPLIVVSSPKGGVGKTTLTANLSVALVQAGWRVVAIDFDVQNELRLHFGMPLGDPYGFARHGVDTQDWSSLLLQASNGVYVLPYGEVSVAERLRLEGGLAGGRNFLEPRLRTFLNERDCIVIADTAPGPTVALGALDEMADMRIAVLLADATSLALLPQIERGAFFHASAARGENCWYMLNQVDSRRRLNRDVTAFVEGKVGNRLVGAIREDEAFAESIACQHSVVDHAPLSAGTQDVFSAAEVIGNLILSVSPRKRQAGLL
ncbi:MAG: cellulose biosynthesis protein BcsQ [Parvibaculaceae bacterium]|nr:cellulose biosynthesis protein BcsQ [Parvibaculaceae bacterium]